MGHPGAGVINAAGKTAAQVIKCARPKEREIRRMARDEAKAAGGTVTDQAEQWLMDALGTDSLELLLAAVRQAIADAPDGRVDEDAVHDMFPVQGKVSAFAVVDHVGRSDHRGPATPAHHGTAGAGVGYQSSLLWLTGCG